MPDASLVLKIVKDACVDEADLPGHAQLQLLGLSMLPFTVYARVELPPAQAAGPLALRFVWQAEAGGGPAPACEFWQAALPAPAAAGAPGRGRRLLLMLYCPDAPDGRYRVGVMQDGEMIASAEVVRRPDHVRAIGRPPHAPGPDPVPVLLSGNPKSGTTWLEKIVDAHPDALVLHEGNTLNIFEHPDLTQQLEARHEHFRFKGYIAWFNPAYDAGDLARLVQIATAREILRSFGRAWGARIVADRTSNYAGFYLHLLRFWPEAKMVHIVRHPLDVLASRLFHEANLGRNPEFPVDLPRPFVDRLNGALDGGETLAAGDYLTDADAQSGGFATLMREWRREQRRFMGASRAVPGAFHLLRYERLLADFDAEAAALFAFLGTEPSRTDLAAIREATRFSALSGGRAAGEEDARSFFRKGVAGDWRRIFSPAQAQALWAHVADAAVPLGYALD